ncbi:MAG: glycerate kinase, partial [Actinomycetota bacterium]|nr:glycerate kinase [Actinomycetota bacterium]
HAAAQGACRKAQALGLAARVVTTELGGEAREASRRCLAADANEELLIFSGETTVAVRGSGRGGRNQEAALAAALQLEGDRHSLFAALATDGVDGPTDAAGGLVDGRSVQRGWAVGLEAAQHLAENDSYPFLSASRDLLVTGPTGTNVGDVWLVYRGDQV